MQKMFIEESRHTQEAFDFQRANLLQNDTIVNKLAMIIINQEKEIQNIRFELYNKIKNEPALEGFKYEKPKLKRPKFSKISDLLKPRCRLLFIALMNDFQTLGFFMSVKYVIDYHNSFNYFGLANNSDQNLLKNLRIPITKSKTETVESSINKDATIQYMNSELDNLKIVVKKSICDNEEMQKQKLDLEK